MENFWVIEDFCYGEIDAELINFEVDGNQYIMVFNRVSQDDEWLYEYVGIEIGENSFQVKFDTKDNFDKPHPSRNQ